MAKAYIFRVKDKTDLLSDPRVFLTALKANDLKTAISKIENLYPKPQYIYEYEPNLGSIAS